LPPERAEVLGIDGGDCVTESPHPESTDVVVGGGQRVVATPRAIPRLESTNVLGDEQQVITTLRPESTDVVIGEDVLKAILSRINILEEELKKHIDRQ